MAASAVWHLSGVPSQLGCRAGGTQRVGGGYDTPLMCAGMSVIASVAVNPTCQSVCLSFFLCPFVYMWHMDIYVCIYVWLPV